MVAKGGSDEHSDISLATVKEVLQQDWHPGSHPTAAWLSQVRLQLSHLHGQRVLNPRRQPY